MYLGGAVLATTGISLSSDGLILTGEAGWLSRGAKLPLPVGAVLLLAFLMVERHAASPRWATLGCLPYLLALIASSHNRSADRTLGCAARLSHGGLLIDTAGLTLLAGLDRHSASLTDLLPGLITLPIGTTMMFASSAVIATSELPIDISSVRLGGRSKEERHETRAELGHGHHHVGCRIADGCG